jgi:ankyrin repeat protein
LHFAAAADSARCVKLLLEYGCDVHATDALGDTPMHKAGRSKCNEIYRMLKAAGCNEHQKNLTKDSPRSLLFDDY